MDNSKEALRLAKNLVRIGVVNSINSTEGSVSVLFPDKDNLVSNYLPMLSSEYNMPNPGDQVLCLFLGNGLGFGFCLGKFYSEVSRVPTSNENLYRKQFDDGTYIEYDKQGKSLKIKSAKPLKLQGDVIIEGNLNVSGTVSASNV